MKFSRLTLAATLSSALVLSACTEGSGSEETTGSTAPATGAATPADDDATATQDDAATTDEAAATDDAATTDEAATTDGAAATDDAATTDAAGTTAMATEEMTAAISLEEAEEVAQTVLTARYEADQGDGDDIRPLQRASMMGSVRTAHEAADQLESVAGTPEERDLEEDPVEPNVLAISKDDGQNPILLLVQTVPVEGEAPLLHLLESRTGQHEDFRISWEAPMLPDTTVPTFDRRSVGSPVVRSGQAELAMEPRELLRSVGAYTSYPQPEEVPEYRTHGYAPSVRRAATEQAEAVAGQATLQEKNWLVSEDIKTLLFDDGTGFVMGTLLRDTQFSVNSGSELTPPDTFRVFQDDAVLRDEAVLRTMVFVGMHLPTEDEEFVPEMIAAREQLVDAWGN